MMPTPNLHIPTTFDQGPVSYAIFQLARAHLGFAAGLLRELDLHPVQVVGNQGQDVADGGPLDAVGN